MAARAPPTTIFCGWLTSQGKIAGVRCPMKCAALSAALRMSCRLGHRSDGSYVLAHLATRKQWVSTVCRNALLVLPCRIASCKKRRNRNLWLRLRFFEIRQLAILPSLGWLSTYCLASPPKRRCACPSAYELDFCVLKGLPQKRFLREEERQRSAFASRQTPACLKRSLPRRGNRWIRKPLSPEWLRLLDLKPLESSQNA